MTYFLHDLGYRCFGRDEFGSRVLPALLGMVQVVLVFLLLTGPLGQPTALATALLIALWPEHIHRSQENRFYMTACLTASLCMLAGAQAVYRRSLSWYGLAGLLAGVAVFTHTLLAVLWGGLFLGYFAAAYITADVQLRRWPGGPYSERFRWWPAALLTSCPWRRAGIRAKPGDMAPLLASGRRFSVGLAHCDVGRGWDHCRLPG